MWIKPVFTLSCVLGTYCWFCYLLIMINFFVSISMQSGSLNLLRREKDNTIRVHVMYICMYSFQNPNHETNIFIMNEIEFCVCGSSDKTHNQFYDTRMQETSETTMIESHTITFYIAFPLWRMKSWFRNDIRVQYEIKTKKYRYIIELKVKKNSSFVFVLQIISFTP
jgi:hypothetical protein